MKRLILKVFSIISIIMLFLTFHKIYGFEFGFGVKSFVKKVIEKGQQEGKIKKEEGEGGESGGGGEQFYVEVIWDKQLGGSTTDYGTSLAVDKSGNIYVSGVYCDSNNFKNYIVLAKFSPSGEKGWEEEKKIEGSSADICWGVAVDPSGDYVYITGNTFGSLSDGKFDGEDCPGNGDIFLTKYKSDGTKLWTKVLGTADGYEAAYNITVDSSGYVYIVGATNGSFGTGGHQGGLDGFLAKLDSNGNLLWKKQIGTSKDEECWGVGTDSSGNIYVTVISSSTQGLGGLLIKYNSEGGKVWEETFGKEGPLDLTVDSSGNIYVTGCWLDVDLPALKIFLAKYGTSEEGKISHNKHPGAVGFGVAAGTSEVYVTGGISPSDKRMIIFFGKDACLVLAKYSLSGEERWTQELKSGSCGFDIAVDSSYIYITGFTTTTGSNRDIFLMKLR